MGQDSKILFQKGNELIHLINSKCFEAYYTGETVRNFLLSQEVKNIDISTNASMEYLEKIIGEARNVKKSDDALIMTYQDITFTFTPFLKEIRDNKGKVVYCESDSIMDDINRRTFTIDAIAMDANSNFVDTYGGLKDLTRKKIRFIGKGKTKIIDNPFSSLEAIKLVSTLGFDLDHNTLKDIKNSHALKNISFEDMLPYLDDILRGDYLRLAVGYIYATGLYKDIPILGEELLTLSKKYQKIPHDMLIAKALTRYEDIDDDLLNICDNPVKIKKVVELAIVTPKSEYDDILLFNYGKEIAVLANQVNALLGNTNKCKSLIEDRYDNLPIKRVCDLQYKGENILKEYPNIDGELIYSIIDDVKYNVLTKKINNNYNEIKDFVNELINNIFKQESLKRKTLVLPKTNILQENKFVEYEKQLMELTSDERIAYEAMENELNSDIDALMQKYYEALEKIEIDSIEKETLSKKVRNSYKKLLINTLEKYKILRENKNEQN